MSILITGATGYFGNRLANSLSASGKKVRVLVRDKQKATAILLPEIEIFKGDLLDKDLIELAMYGCEEVFHAAAFVGTWSSRPQEIFDVNVKGTQNLLDSALENGVKKFIYTSSCGTIGPAINKPMREDDPRPTGFTNDYELSKFLAERKVKAYAKLGLHTVIVNASKIFGPGLLKEDKGINRQISRYIQNKFVFCPSPDTLISNYVFSDDLVKGHLLAAEFGLPGENYIIGGYNLTFHDFFQLLARVNQKKGRLIKVNESVSWLLAYIYFFSKRIKGQTPLFTPKNTDMIFCNKIFDISKASKELGYQPTPVEESFRQTIQFLKSNQHEPQNLHLDYGIK